ncbi:MULTISPECIES: hypothetical protein [Streptomyces]|uniref:hypothetical protein n=1 Tax=Streptomyces TaxID=1883 RepID=UPI0026B5283C|nr:hypothetical protein [Streptomyces sp. HG99]
MESLVTLGDGVFPLVALAEGKNATGMALVRAGSGVAPSLSLRPKELDGKILTAVQLRATDDVQLTSEKVDRVHRIEPTGGMYDRVRSSSQRAGGRAARRWSSRWSSAPVKAPPGRRAHTSLITWCGCINLA